MEVKINLSDKEVKTLKEWLPRLEHLKMFVPESLISLVRKLEDAVKGI